MFDFDYLYEPDEVLMDVDSFDVEWQDEDVSELSFENEKDASEGFALLSADVDSPDELFEMA